MLPVDCSWSKHKKICIPAEEFFGGRCNKIFGNAILPPTSANCFLCLSGTVRQDFLQKQGDRPSSLKVDIEYEHPLSRQQFIQFTESPSHLMDYLYYTVLGDNSNFMAHVLSKPEFLLFHCHICKEARATEILLRNESLLVIEGNVSPDKLKATIPIHIFNTAVSCADPACRQKRNAIIQTLSKALEKNFTETKIYKNFGKPCNK